MRWIARSHRKVCWMKLVVVGPVYPYRGGIAHYTALSSQALAKTHQVRVISFRRQYPRWLYPGKTDQDTSRQPLQVKAEYPLDPLYPWTWLQVSRQIMSYKPDGVVFQWWTTFWAAAFASLAYSLRKRGIPSLFIVHNVLPHEARFFDAWLARLALSQGKAYIAGTRREQERLEVLLPGSNVIVCPHPIYDMFAGQRISKEEARSRLGLPEKAQIALQFGIVRPYKGLKFLIDAVALLKQQGTDLHLLVAGEFWEDKNSYIEQARRLGVADLLHMEDRYIPNEEVAVLFSAADVFAAPYVDGTQSGAMKMALGFGLPVVATNIIAEQGCEEPGPLLHRVPPGDSKALAQALQESLQERPPALPDVGAAPIGADWDRLVKAVEEGFSLSRQKETG